MEFDWIDVYFDLSKVIPKEIEESFEDPFAIKLLPDGDYGNGKETRYFCLGKTIQNRPVFSVFWTNGKQFRVVLSREMSETELNFYERKNASLD